MDKILWEEHLFYDPDKEEYISLQTGNDRINALRELAKLRQYSRIR